MSAQTLQHVRERLRTSKFKRFTKGDFEFLEYAFASPFPWPDALYVVELSLAKGWIAAQTDWQAGTTAITKLRFARPVNFVLTDRLESSSSPTPLGGIVEGGKGGVSTKSRRTVDLDRNEQQEPSVQNTLSVHKEPELENVLSYFEARTGKKRTDRAIERTRAALLSWSSETLCTAIDTALAKPGARRAPSLTNIIKGVLGEPTTTFLTPYYRCWQEFSPEGKFEFGRWAPILKEFEDQHGATHTLEQFRGYISQTEPSYVSAQRFAVGFGRWRSAKTKLASSDAPLTVKVL